MSTVLANAKHSIELLLSTSKQQQKGLLDTATPQQITALCEIAQNLLHLPHSKGVRASLHRRKKLPKQLGNKAYSLRTKTTLERRHLRQLLDTLLMVKKHLLVLLR